MTIILFVSCGQRNNHETSSKASVLTLDTLATDNAVLPFENETSSKTSVLTSDTLTTDNYVLFFENADSFPTTDIYGDLNHRINLTDTIGNWHDRATRIQAYLIDKFGDYFYTTDSTVVLRLANGKTKSFANWDHENEEGYTFEHYFAKINYYLLRVQWVEGNCWMLVNRKNGFKKYINGLPYISADNKKILAINTDLEAAYSFNGIELYAVLADSLQQVFSKETVFGPIDVKWLGENQFLLKREHLHFDRITWNQDYIIDYKRVTIEKKTSR